MKPQRLLGALSAGLMLFSISAKAAEQASYVTPVAGPMTMATFAGTYLNPALRAIASCHNGSSAPANGPSGAPIPYQCWIDTTSNPALYKIYDSASWITLGAINTSTHAWSPYFTGGVSGGVPFFAATNVMGSSALLAQYGFMLGGGAGAPPTTIAACTDDQVPFGRTSNSPLCRTITGDITYASGVSAIGPAKVTSAMLRNSGALSFIGRSANSSGIPADISATAASDAVLRESGSTLGFGTIATGGIANNAVTLSKLATQGANTALANATSGSAVPTAFSMPSCSISASALNWTTNTGFGCNTAISVAIANVTGLGTGVGTALAVNIGTAGSFVINGGALGSPSSVGTMPTFTMGGNIIGGGGGISGLYSLAVTNNITLANTQNAGSSETITNTSTGSSAFGSYAITNSNGSANFGLGGSGYTAQSSLLQNKGYVYTDTALAGIALYAETGKVIDFYVGGTRAAGVNSSGVFTATNPILTTPNIGTPSAGVGTNLTGTAPGLTAGSVTTNANQTGDVTSVGNATTLTNAPVIAKVLTGFTSGTGTVTAADSILTATQKLYGNDALKAPLASPALTGVPTAPTASPGTNNTQIATAAYADAIGALKVNATRNISTGCGLAGGGDLSADRAIRLSHAINAQTGTSYTILDADCGKLVSLSNASAVAVSLPQANGSTFVSGWSVDFQNRGTGTATITPVTSTINGGASLALSQNQGMHCQSDGTNYTCMLGVGAGGGSGTVTSVSAGAGLSSGGSPITASGTISLDGSYGRNLIDNPSGEINQAGVGSQSNGTYDFDQWYVLTQTAAITSSQQTDLENSTPFAMRMSQAQASAQRFGRVQWMEKLRVRHLRGQNVVLSARVQMSASTTLRYAVVEWTGTADAITKNLVNNWTSGTFTTGNFFTSTSTTVVVTGSIALTANTLTDITPITGTVSSSMNNLAVFYWTDSAQAQNVTLDVAKVKLEPGALPTPFVARGWEQELQAAQRYFEKSYDYATAIASVAGGGSAWIFSSSSATQAGVTVYFKTRKRASPTMTGYSPNSGASGQAYDYQNTVDVAVNNNFVGENSWSFYVNRTNAPTNVAAQWTANARL